MFEGPIIDGRIKNIASGFRAVSVYVDATSAGEGRFDPRLLGEACDCALADGPAWAEAHLASWSDAYVVFGAKPNRTPCSAQALRKRVLKDGTLSTINPIVDLYNAISLKYAVPVGGENFDAYVGRPHLTIADGSETFDTMSTPRVWLVFSSVFNAPERTPSAFWGARAVMLTSPGKNASVPFRLPWNASAAKRLLSWVWVHCVPMKLRLWRAMPNPLALTACSWHRCPTFP